MLESSIEKALVMQARRKGGVALKFVSPGTAGVPDRLVLLPGKKIAFVELKAPGKKPRPLQIKRKEQIEALGFKVWVIDQIDEVPWVLREIEGSDGS
jgi:hypothetical protein